MGALASVNGLESTCRRRSVAELVSTWVKIRRGWRHSVLLQALLLLFFALTPQGPQRKEWAAWPPLFPSLLPKTSMKCVQLKASLSPWVTRSAHTPQPSNLMSFTPWRKTKKKENAYRRIVVQLWGYSHSARTQRATEWPPTAQGSIQRRPSTLRGFWHAKCSHCLVDDMVR